MTPLGCIIVILVAYIISLAFTAGARKILLRRAVLDNPNERSMHANPVPRGGGWALLAVLLPGMWLFLPTADSLSVHGGIILGTLLLAFVSWRDDRKGMSPAARLAAHIAAACIGSLAFGSNETIFDGALPFWLDRSVMIIGWAWFMNLYNFMDGIDGITSTETITLAAGACLLLPAAGIMDPFPGMLGLLLAGVSLGFLAFNWHPAKIFLGDVGSVPLGFLTGYLLLVLATHHLQIPALILPLYYLADSGITLIKRALRREKIWQAHRQHFYQRAAQAVGRHDKVTLWIALADLALIGTALAAVFQPVKGLAAAIAIVAVVLLKMHKAARSKPI